MFSWFDDKIVIKRKTIDICKGETVPYKKTSRKYMFLDQKY